MNLIVNVSLCTHMYIMTTKDKNGSLAGIIQLCIESVYGHVYSVLVELSHRLWYTQHNILYRRHLQAYRVREESKEDENIETVLWN